MKNAIAFVLLVFSVSQLHSQYYYVEKSIMMEYRESHQVSHVQEDTPNINGLLSCGGWNGNEVLASAEFYSYGEESWSPVSDMSTPRMDFAMVGRMVAGGYDGIGPFSLASTEIFDPATETWNPGPELSVGRSFLRGSQLWDNRIFFTGGFDGASEVATVDLYDPATNTMTSVAPMNFARSSHTATMISGNRLLVTGGFNAEEGFQMNQCEIYDIDTDTWTVIAPLNVARDNHSCAFMTSSVTEAASTPPIAIVTGGRVYDAELDHFVALAEAEIYDFELNTWQVVQLPSGMSYHHSFISALGNFLLVAGGPNFTGLGVEMTYNDPIEIHKSTLMANSIEFSENYFPFDNRYRSAACETNGQSGLTGAICGGDEAGVGTAELWFSAFLSVEEQLPPRNGLFPNPAVDRMRITGERFDRWEVIDASSGRIVDNGNEWYVEVAHLAPGRYNLVIYQEGAPSSHGFIKVNR